MFLTVLVLHSNYICIIETGLNNLPQKHYSQLKHTQNYSQYHFLAKNNIQRLAQQIQIRIRRAILLFEYCLLLRGLLGNSNLH
jgi:hypothetical protein